MMLCGGMRFEDFHHVIERWKLFGQSNRIRVLNIKKVRELRCKSVAWEDRRLQFGDYRSCSVVFQVHISPTNKHWDFGENVESSEPGAASSCLFHSAVKCI